MAADTILRVDALSLLRAAKIWQAVRIFRLVMLRKRDGQNPRDMCFSKRWSPIGLAHLPDEILSMLVSEVYTAALSVLWRAWPYSDGCQCHPYRTLDDVALWPDNMDFLQWLTRRRLMESKQDAITSTSVTPSAMVHERHSNGLTSIHKRSKSCTVVIRLSFDEHDTYAWRWDQSSNGGFEFSTRGLRRGRDHTIIEQCHKGCGVLRSAILRDIQALVAGSRVSAATHVIIASESPSEADPVPGRSSAGTAHKHSHILSASEQVRTVETFMREHSLCFSAHVAERDQDDNDDNRSEWAGYYSQGTKMSVSLGIPAAARAHWQAYFNATDAKHEVDPRARDKA